jgi:hypothetical protein
MPLGFQLFAFCKISIQWLAIWGFFRYTATNRRSVCDDLNLFTARNASEYLLNQPKFQFRALTETLRYPTSMASSMGFGPTRAESSTL